MTFRTTTRAVAALLAALVVGGMLAGCATKSAQAPQSAGQAAGGGVSVTLELSESTSDVVTYLRQQAEQLDGGTAEFAAAYSSGNDGLARALYAPTRMFYNRMLVVQSSFSGLATSIDGQQTDLPAGTPFTGWHAIEQDLYPASNSTPLNPEQRTALATRLAGDTHSLYEKIFGLRPTVNEQTEGAATLMQTLGVAAANGTQDPGSGSDISDLQGYLDGAHLVFEGIRVVLVTQDAALATTLDHEFGSLQDSLNAQRIGVSFTPYDQVSSGDLASLQSQVKALGDSLARVTTTMAPATATPSPSPAG
ncbi:MAG: PbrT family lead (Pb2+) uptake porter [Subtercola sp.]|nr:PbrT family lead (Pb2+) uptake porter [Subtercola sp.]